MRTVSFTIDDEQAESLGRAARDMGLRGRCALSEYCRLTVIQTTGLPEGGRRGILVHYLPEEYERLVEYVACKKGYAGPNPIATFVHKAAFDIMAKYPVRKAPQTLSEVYADKNHGVTMKCSRAVQLHDLAGAL